MSVNLIDKPEIGALISPQGNKKIPIHNWFSFRHGYSRDLVVYLVKNFGLSKGSWILDPFCGSGTTLLSCKELGINALGFDILPYSVFLSNVKVSDYDYVDLSKRFEILKKTAVDANYLRENLPDIPLVRKAFSPEVKQSLIALKSRIDAISDPKSKHFFNLGFLSILESVSNTSKSGGFLRITDRDIPPTVIESRFLKKINTMLIDLSQENSSTKKKVSVKAKIGDARKLPTKRKFDSIITSPPYPNRHDYTRIYSLEMVFDFVSTNQELKNIRYDTIRSHVEARKKYRINGYKKPTIIDKFIKEINMNGTNNPQVVAMLEGYFEDMYLSLRQMSRCIKPKGKIALVVSNVRFAGVNVPVDEILLEIGSQIGLVPKTIWVARHRGNSSQQMGKYKRKPSRESVVIWEKGN